MTNCSDVSLLPISEDYYADLEPAKSYFIYVDVVLTVAILAIFVEECRFVIISYKHYDITVKSLWLISIYPVFAVSALLAVLIPRASYICDFVSTCYLSACFFQFSSLLLLYFGGFGHLLHKVRDSGFRLRVGPCCCCCLCCPVLPPQRRSLLKVRLMIFQTAVLQPIIQFISAVLWADSKYQTVGIDFTQSYVYLNILKLTSTFTAIYGLSVLHSATRQHLTTHNTTAKMTALQLVQVFFNIQGAIITIPARFNIPPCTQYFSSHFLMLQWHHLVLIVELFLLSLLARIFYRRPLELDTALDVLIDKKVESNGTGTSNAAENTGACSSDPSIQPGNLVIQVEKTISQQRDCESAQAAGNPLAITCHSQPESSQDTEDRTTEGHKTFSNKEASNSGVVNKAFREPVGDKNTAGCRVVKTNVPPSRDTNTDDDGGVQQNTAQCSDEEPVMSSEVNEYIDAEYFHPDSNGVPQHEHNNCAPSEKAEKKKIDVRM